MRATFGSVSTSGFIFGVPAIRDLIFGGRTRRIYGRWFMISFVLLASVFCMDSAKAACQAGKVEVQIVLKNGNVRSVCVPDTAQQGMQGAGQNSGGAIPTVACPCFDETDLANITASSKYAARCSFPYIDSSDTNAAKCTDTDGTAVESVYAARLDTGKIVPKLKVNYPTDGSVSCSELLPANSCIAATLTEDGMCGTGTRVEAGAPEDMLACIAILQLAGESVDYDGDSSNSVVDCDDYDSTVFPGATELCDGKDNDCDAAVDEIQQCQLGTVQTATCPDATTEVCATAITNLIVGSDFYDVDFVYDTFDNLEGGGGIPFFESRGASDLARNAVLSALNSTVASSIDYTVNVQDGRNFWLPVEVHHTPLEIQAFGGRYDAFRRWYNLLTRTFATDLLAGYALFTPVPPFDGDSDGHTIPAGDCNDRDSSVFPGAVEICDLKDNDCDGQTDELCP